MNATCTCNLVLSAFVAVALPPAIVPVITTVTNSNSSIKNMVTNITSDNNIVARLTAAKTPTIATTEVATTAAMIVPMRRIR